MEEDFDEIAKGQKIWNELIEEFYNPFHKQIEDTLKISRKVSGEKLLGKDPESGKNVYVKLGKYGPLIQIGETDATEKPRFAGLLKGQSMETITLEQALELFKFPKTIGKYEDDDLVVGVGRFGPYIRHKGLFYALKKTDDPLTIESPRAIELIEEKRNKSSKKVIREFKENEHVKVLNGRYGPYISMDKNNYRIPKGTDPESLSLEDCMQIIEKAEEKKKK